MMKSSSCCGLELAVQVRVNAKLHVQLFTHALAQRIDRARHHLEILIRRAAGPAASGVRLLHLAAEPPAEAGHSEMVFDHGLSRVKILKAGVARGRAAA